MQEQRIEHRTAILAKEKGFDLKTRFYFDNEGNPLEDNYDNGKLNWNSNIHPYEGEQPLGVILKETYSRPTQSLLQKWIREKHNIHIKVDDFIDDETGTEWDYEVVLIGTDLDENGNYIALIPYSIDDKNRKFKTFEEALEEGLFQTLNLIKI